MASISLMPDGFIKGSVGFSSAAEFNQEVEKHLETTGALHHHSDNLRGMYSLFHIKVYDYFYLGFLAMAQRLAMEVLLEANILSFLDIGCGTGHLLLSTLARVSDNRKIGHVSFLDGLEGMLVQTTAKLTSAIPNLPCVDTFDIATSITALHRFLDPISTISADLLNSNASPPTNILMTNFLSTQPIDRWGGIISGLLELGAPGATITVEIPHPSKVTGLAFFTQSTTLPELAASRYPVHCIRLAKDSAYKEARDHAIRMAYDHNLQLRNHLPAVKPASGVIDQQDKVAIWSKAVTANLGIGEFSSAQQHYLNAQYVAAIRTGSYGGRAVLVQGHGVAVIAVFALK